MLHYRREIDGLRAVAVVPVVLHHAGAPIFAGGFVGVDVFFVISGFLITSIILSEREEGRYSILRFYERRARRILPALFMVLTASAALAWLFLVPGDMRDFTRSLRYVLIFYSNHFFYRQTGYFATEAELQPLLHTWSLAVEEQYYLVIPLILAFLRPRKALVTALFGLLILSLVWSQYLITTDPAAAFFRTTSRFWELLMGSLLAILLRRTPQAPPGNADLLAAAGLILIMGAVFAFDENTPFPGANALVPTLGTALVLAYATQQTRVGSLLSTPLLVGLGLISYSLYLWHQPLLVFARFASGATVHPLVPPGAVTLSVALAYLTWRFVETPFRRPATVGRPALVAFSASFLVVLLAFGFGGRVTDGYAFRSPKAEELAERMQLDMGLGKECSNADTFQPQCMKGDAPDILVWGDSYAAHLMAGLLKSVPNLGVIQMTKHGCGPIFDVAPIGVMKGNGWLDECIARNDLVLDLLRAYPSVKYVVVSSPFMTYFSDSVQVYLRDGAVRKGSDVSLELFMLTLAKLRSAGVIPIVVSPPPKNGQDVGRCAARLEFFGRDRRGCDFELRSSTAASAEFRRMRALLDDGGYKSIDLSEAICSHGVCRPNIDGTILYSDNGHLTREGSIFVFERLGIGSIFGKAKDPQ